MMNFSPLRSAPSRIQKAVMELSSFCRKNNVKLVLIGSHAGRKFSKHADWDFGVFFQERWNPKGFKETKRKLLEDVFPYKIDIIRLNEAPSWFLESVTDNVIPLIGPLPSIFKEVA